MNYIVLTQQQAASVQGDYPDFNIVPYKLNATEYILPIDLIARPELGALNLSQYPQRDVLDNEFPQPPAI